jgi:hypothetical protein
MSAGRLDPSETATARTLSIGRRAAFARNPQGTGESGHRACVRVGATSRSPDRVAGAYRRAAWWARAPGRNQRTMPAESRRTASSRRALYSGSLDRAALSRLVSTTVGDRESIPAIGLPGSVAVTLAMRGPC